MPTNNKNRFYVLNGEIYPLEDEKPAEYIIGSSSDLTALVGNVFPGSIARIAGTKTWYEMKPNGEWSDAHSEEGGSGGNEFVVPTYHYNGANYIWSHTFAEVLALIEAGNCYFIREDRSGDGSSGYIYYPIYGYDDEEIVIKDIYIIPEDGGFVRNAMLVYSAEGTSVTVDRYPEEEEQQQGGNDH